MIISLLYRLIRTRYRVRIDGLAHLHHTGPLLVLPNHPAMIDPVIILSHLSRGRNILSPVVTEQFYNKPVLHTLFRTLDAIPVPDLESGSSDTQGVKHISQCIVDHLSQGKHVLLYPSGQTYRQGYESIIGKKTTYEVIQSLPSDTKILLVRTKGLWGSIFSKAYFGTPVPLGKIARYACRYALSNLICWGPRRTVSIHIEDGTQSLITQARTGSLATFNTYLESWYNKPGTEQPTFVRHYRWWNDGAGRHVATHIEGSVADMSAIDRDYSQISDTLIQELSTLIAQVKKIQTPVTYQATTTLLIDIQCDSLDMAEIKTLIMTSYPHAQDTSLLSLKTVGDLGLMAMGVSLGVSALPPYQHTHHHQKQRYKLDLPSDHTILSYRGPSSIAGGTQPRLYDITGGVQTHADIRLKALLVSRYLKQFKDRHIGVMLPAVASTHIVLLACYMAGKIPVMMNWTVGSEMFGHCIHTSGIRHIITSQRFTSVLRLSRLDDYNPHIVYLEQLLSTVGLPQKLLAFIQSISFAWLGDWMMPRIRPSDPAVILFTSGSESKPKSIVLSHHNVLSNLSGVLQSFDLSSSDILLHCLPPFHSFGYTVNTVLSCVTGLRVVASPNPTDASMIVRLIVHTRATVITATPTFLYGILTTAQPGQLHTLRAAIVGAEKCPPHVMELFAQHCPDGEIIEGYGITECSPVIAVNPPGATKPGTVGKPLPNGLLIIKDLEKHHICGAGEQGMIYWSAPSVFAGYQDKRIESPFEDIDGRLYYKTGDLGYLDADGYLTITGRLKRFVKIAGEMISLPAIEQHLHHWLDEHYPLDTETKDKKIGPRIALEAKESEDGRVRFVVFVTIAGIHKDILQQYLIEQGVPSLVHLSDIHELESIPLLGTGKTDYKVLKAMIE